MTQQRIYLFIQFYICIILCSTTLYPSDNKVPTNSPPMPNFTIVVSDNSMHGSNNTNNNLQATNDSQLSLTHNVNDQIIHTSQQKIPGYSWKNLKNHTASTYHKTSSALWNYKWQILTVGVAGGLGITVCYQISACAPLLTKTYAWCSWKSGTSLAITAAAALPDKKEA